MRVTVSLSSCICTTALAAGLLGNTCLATEPTAPEAQVATGTGAASSPAAPYPGHLYVVYCDGRVDHLDLAGQAKVGSFHLSERSGSFPTAQPPQAPQARRQACLARPVVTGSAQDGRSGMAHIVAAGQLARDAQGRMPYRLLSFSLPDWTLQKTRELGSFDVLNGAAPRMTRASNGHLAALPQGIHPGTEAATGVADYSGARSWSFMRVTQWSGNGLLLDYAAPGDNRGGAALADRTQRSLTRIERPAGEANANLRLAPGGRYALRPMLHTERVGNRSQVTATGVLRLYGPDGRQAAVITDKRVAGDWHCIAITPQGFAVFTDRHGGYRFVSLGRSFGNETVASANEDDWDGTRPGLVYSLQ